MRKWKRIRISEAKSVVTRQTNKASDFTYGAKLWYQDGGKWKCKVVGRNSGDIDLQGNKVTVYNLDGTGKQTFDLSSGKYYVQCSLDYKPSGSGLFEREQDMDDVVNELEGGDTNNEEIELEEPEDDLEELEEPEDDLEVPEEPEDDLEVPEEPEDDLEVPEEPEDDLEELEEPEDDLEVPEEPEDDLEVPEEPEDDLEEHLSRIESMIKDLLDEQGGEKGTEVDTPPLEKVQEPNLSDVGLGDEKEIKHKDVVVAPPGVIVKPDYSSDSSGKPKDAATGHPGKTTERPGDAIDDTVDITQGPANSSDLAGEKPTLGEDQNVLEEIDRARILVARGVDPDAVAIVLLKGSCR